MTRFRDFKIAEKLMLLVGIFLAGSALFGIFSFRSLEKVKVNGPLYTLILHNQEVIQDILPPPLFIIEARLNALQMLQKARAGVNRETLESLAADASRMRKEYDERYTFWMKTLEEGEVKESLARARVPAMEFSAPRRKSSFRPSFRDPSIRLPPCSVWCCSRSSRSTGLCWRERSAWQLSTPGRTSGMPRKR